MTNFINTALKIPAVRMVDGILIVNVDHIAYETSCYIYDMCREYGIPQGFESDYED